VECKQAVRLQKRRQINIHKNRIFPRVSPRLDLPLSVSLSRRLIDPFGQMMVRLEW
jgi:hypothetical protein